MQYVDYSKYKHRVLTDDSRLHLDEINGTLEQTGKNPDGSYNFILTVPTRRYKRPVKNCKRYMFGALGFRTRSKKHKFVYLFGFKGLKEVSLFIRLGPKSIYSLGSESDNLSIKEILKAYHKETNIDIASLKKDAKFFDEVVSKK